MTAPSTGSIDSVAKLVEAAGKTNLTLAALLALMVGVIGYKVVEKQTGKNAWQGIAVFLVISAFSFFLMLHLLPSQGQGSTDKGGSGAPATVPPPQSDLVYVQLLSKIDKAERAPLCRKLTDEKKCGDILALIDDIVPPPATNEQQQQLAAAIDKGDVTAAKTVASSITQADPLADRVVTLGSPQGWDMDVFWCEGLSDTKIHAQANLVAQALAGVPGGKLGDSQLGRISLRRLASARQGRNGLPSSGLAILIDDNQAAEGRLATALQRYLQSKNGLAFDLLRQKGGVKPDYSVSLFVCS